MMVGNKQSMNCLNPFKQGLFVNFVKGRLRLAEERGGSIDYNEWLLNLNINSVRNKLGNFKE